MDIITIFRIRLRNGAFYLCEETGYKNFKRLFVIFFADIMRLTAGNTNVYTIHTNVRAGIFC